MSIFTTWTLRLFGISGIIGSILFIFGDLFYDHLPDSKNSPTVKMSKMPESRLLNAGTLGLVGCWFYTFEIHFPCWKDYPNGQKRGDETF